MQIETTRFGLLDVDESKFIHFTWGLPAFEDLKRYILMEHKEGPFHWLQAVDDPGLAFITCPPEVFGVKYDIPPAKKEVLGLRADEDVLILNMVSIAREKGLIRFHVRSPLLFNMFTRTGCQWSMDSDEVRKHLVMPEGVSGAVDLVEALG